MIIYPPIIGDTIPAFVQNNLIIPFTHNPAVEWKEVKGFSLIIKELANSKQIENVQITDNTKFDINNIIFDLNNIKLTSGNYYKFQIAYLDANSKISPYSSVAIGRYIGTVAPTVTIEGLEINKINQNKNIYKGIYTNNVLSTETIYQYCFEFFEGENLLQTSDWQLYKDSMEFKVLQELEYSKNYNIKLSIKTINGYETSVSYNIIKPEEYPALIEAEVLATQDREALENGYVDIKIDITKPFSGNYELLRKAAAAKSWDIIASFKISDNSELNKYCWKDFTVEQGIEYIYAIRHADDEIVSAKILSTPIKAQFEHLFLSDNEHSLCIRFNPKVSSFKNNILEQKTDTIGGQYPFFFRNGSVNYKEISISGLISYHMDMNNYFITNKDLIDSIDLTEENFTAERKFKLAVLEWLNDGKPKLFRSPAEGNYVVRLMNVSLSPNDQLGRMINTFQATGYECAAADYEYMKNNGLVNNSIIETVIEPTNIQTLQISEHIGEEEYYLYNVKNIVYQTSTPASNIYIELDGNTIYNTTGYISTPEDTVYKEVIIPVNINMYSTITYTQLSGNTVTRNIDDNYTNLIKNSVNQIWTTDNITEKIIYKYYFITFVPKDANAYVEINGNKIKFTDKNSRTYYNLSGDSVTEMYNINATIYARVKKEEDTNA